MESHGGAAATGFGPQVCSATVKPWEQNCKTLAWTHYWQHTLPLKQKKKKKKKKKALQVCVCVCVCVCVWDRTVEEK